MKIRMNSRGVTLIETVVALAIISISVMGLVQAFSFGRDFVEKAGLRRQGLALVQQELEYWRSVRQTTPGAVPIAFGEGREAVRTVPLSETGKINAVITTDISPVQNADELTYQRVAVSLQYEHALQKDSIHVETRMYLR